MIMANSLSVIQNFNLFQYIKTVLTVYFKEKNNAGLLLYGPKSYTSKFSIYFDYGYKKV